MAEWTRILTYTRRSIVSEYKHGILQQISQTTPHAVVYFPKSDESKQIHMTWSERIPYMLECIEFCTAFRVEVLIENEHVCTYIISCNIRNFHNQLQNQLYGETYIISLLKNMWKQSTTHSSHVQTPPSISDNVISAHDEHQMWDASMILLDHQKNSLAYMKKTEEIIRNSNSFAYNAHIEISDKYFLDVVSEKIVNKKLEKMCRFRGAFLCDETGGGKTVTSLRLISETSPIYKRIPGNYASRATLIIVPLNLPTQWMKEIERFYTRNHASIVPLWTSSHLKQLNMNTLLSCDIVLTTLSFIKMNKTYNEILTQFIDEKIKGNVKKSRALFNCISKNQDIQLPILQIIDWYRIIVDEIHEINMKDFKILKCFTCDVMWGLTATPTLKINVKDELNDLNFMFEETDTYHPNMYKYFVNNFIRGYTELNKTFPSNNLNLVHLSEHEKKKHTDELRRDINIEDTILSLSSFDSGVLHGEISDIDEFIRPEETKIQNNFVTLHNIQKIIITTTLIVTAKWCVENDKLRHNKASNRAIIAKATKLIRNQDFENTSAKSLISFIESLRRKQHFMETNLKYLEANTEICPICMENSCNVIIKCGHLFCKNCITTHLINRHQCPTCRQENLPYQIYRKVHRNESTKLQAIKETTTALNEPVIIFAQWKKVLRDIKSVLTDLKNVVVLEGNTSQRKTIIENFSAQGGVLLLCLNESFSGIRLPYVNNIIFAHALVGDYDHVKALEIQAIGRTINKDNSSLPHVVSFITAESEEEGLWRTNHP